MKLFNYKKCVSILLLILLIDVTLQLQLRKEGENAKNTIKTSVKYMSWTKRGKQTQTMEMKKDYTEPLDYAKQWNILFVTGEKRPASVCEVAKLKIFSPTKKKSDADANGSQYLIPHAKPNVDYNKPGFEDAAYFYDYLDDMLGNDVMTELKRIWDSSVKAPSDPKVKDLYAISSRLTYYSNMGGEGTGAIAPPIDPATEKDQMKIAQNLKIFEPQIDPVIMLGGIKIPQLTAIYKELGMKVNPSLIGWQKKKLDQYDFDGDGTLSAVEFLFLVIWESKNDLDTPKLFGTLTKSKLDPIFEYCDCDADGLITAESLWSCFMELKRPNPESYDYYECRSPKNKNYVRTASTNDVVLKNGEEAQGYLNIKEFQKAIILGFWDRQVTGNDLLPITDTSNNFKNQRWTGETEDRKCPRE
jgi:Ca2+-binding EF-hand superfamily protein